MTEAYQPVFEGRIELTKVQVCDPAILTGQAATKAKEDYNWLVQKKEKPNFLQFG